MPNAEVLGHLEEISQADAQDFGRLVEEYFPDRFDHGFNKYQPKFREKESFLQTIAHHIQVSVLYTKNFWTQQPRKFSSALLVFPPSCQFVQEKIPFLLFLKLVHPFYCYYIFSMNQQVNMRRVWLRSLRTRQSNWRTPTYLLSLISPFLSGGLPSTINY